MTCKSRLLTRTPVPSPTSHSQPPDGGSVPADPRTSLPACVSVNVIRADDLEVLQPGCWAKCFMHMSLFCPVAAPREGLRLFPFHFSGNTGLERLAVSSKATQLESSRATLICCPRHFHIWGKPDGPPPSWALPFQGARHHLPGHHSNRSILGFETSVVFFALAQVYLPFAGFQGPLSTRPLPGLFLPIYPDRPTFQLCPNTPLAPWVWFIFCLSESSRSPQHSSDFQSPSQASPAQGCSST